MKKRIIILSLCLMIFGVLCVKSINKSPVDENEINHIISELFLSRAKLRLHNYEENNNLMFCDEESNFIENKLRKDIIDYNHYSLEQGFYILDCGTEVIINKIDRNHDELEANVKKITFIENQDHVKSAYSALHKIIFQYQHDKWYMKKDIQLEPTGLIPLYKANLYLENNAS